MDEKTKILIVDDHTVLREGLTSLLNSQPDFEVVGNVGTVNDAIAAACNLNPNLILMDIGLPDGTGVDATKAILAKRPNTDIVMLTIHDSDEMLFDAMRSGAKGYLMKNTSMNNLISSLRSLERGEAAISRKMTRRILSGLVNDQDTRPGDDAIQQLTAREVEILAEVSSGATNKEIAERLFISVNTVKNHIHDILRKLDLKNRREARMFAIRNGIKKSPN